MSGWTLMSERKPEAYEDVIVSTLRGDVDIARYYPDGTFWGDGFAYDSDGGNPVVGWMKKPAALGTKEEPSDDGTITVRVVRRPNGYRAHLLMPMRPIEAMEWVPDGRGATILDAVRRLVASATDECMRNASSTLIGEPR